VRVHVRYDRQLAPPEPVRASLIARGPSSPFFPYFVKIDRDDRSFNSDDGWQTLEVSATGPEPIKTIEIIGGRNVGIADQNDNFLAIDNLEFDRTPPPPSADAAPPHITVNLIDANPLKGGFLHIDTNVTDQSELKIVFGLVTEAGSTTAIDLFGFCGTADSYLCPIAVPTNFDETAYANLSETPDGDYEAQVAACDILDQCDIQSVGFSIKKDPLPPHAPRIEAIEVTQGVSGNVDYHVPVPGDSRPYANPPALVRGRNTLVRFYAYSRDDITHKGYTAKLHIQTLHSDGELGSTSMLPNVDGAEEISLRPVPQSLDEDRILASRALNFVIPGSELMDATELRLQLRNVSGVELTGRTVVRLLDPIGIGINAVSLTIYGVPKAAPSRTEIEDVIPYLRGILPVTDVRVLTFRQAQAFVQPVFGNYLCEQVRGSFWFTVGTDEGLVRDYIGFTNLTPVVGFVPNDVLSGSSGCSPVENAHDDENRHLNRIVALARGDIVAHEISHRLGFHHIGGSHGEGGDIEPWPYEHGQVGPTDVGVNINRKISGTPPWLIDFFNPFQPEEEKIPHDYMSYGPQNIRFSVQGNSATGRWISTRNWNRFWDAVIRRVTPSSSSVVPAQTQSADTEPTVDALLVSGVVDQANGGFHALIRKQVPVEFLTEPANSNATLALLDMDGALLQSNPVRVSRIADVADFDTPRLYAIVPYVEGVGQLRLSNDEKVLLEKQGSANAPTVKVLSPSGGEFKSGIVDINWKAEDADGDPLTFLVQYSPDGGMTWESVSLVPPGFPLNVSFGAGEYTAGANAKIRVLASDGIRLAEDFSDCPFSLRAGEPEDCSVDLDVRPGSCSNPLKREGTGVIPVVIVGSDRINVSAIDTSSLALEGVPPKQAAPKDDDSDGACDQKIMDDITDLVVEFDLSEVADALRERLGRELLPGEVLEVTLTGQMATGSATASISGKDTMTIVGD